MGVTLVLYFYEINIFYCTPIIFISLTYLWMNSKNMNKQKILGHRCHKTLKHHFNLLFNTVSDMLFYDRCSLSPLTSPFWEFKWIKHLIQWLECFFLWCIQLNCESIQILDWMINDSCESVSDASQRESGESHWFHSYTI